jgi:hypothetical protein
LRKRFIRQPMRQRIIALVAAYAIALTSLIAGFGAAQAASQAASQAAAQALDGGITAICHSALAEGGPATGSDESNGTICLKCCVGCLTPLATVLPPDVAAAGPPQAAFTRLNLPATGVRIADARSKAHRSRGPPPVL